MMNPRRPPNNDWVFVVLAVARLARPAIWFSLLTYAGVILGMILGLVLVRLGFPSL